MPLEGPISFKDGNIISSQIAAGMYILLPQALFLGHPETRRILFRSLNPCD